MARITLQQLTDAGACKEQLDLFHKLFPNGTDVTEELAIRHAADFDWNWAASRLLSAPAWAEYNKVKAPTWAEYNKVKAPAWARLYNKEY